MSIYAKLAAIFIIFSSGFATGFKFELGRWNAEKVAVLESNVEKDRLRIASNNVDSKRVIDAQNASVLRLSKARNDFDAVSTELERLRGVVADRERNGAAETASDSNQRAAALATVFAECSSELATLARKADGHVNDIRTFVEAGK